MVHYTYTYHMFLDSRRLLMSQSSPEMNQNTSSSGRQTSHAQTTTWIIDQMGDEWVSLSPSAGPSSALSFECPVSLLPAGTQEGDCVQIQIGLVPVLKQKILDDLDEQIRNLSTDDDGDDFSI